MTGASAMVTFLLTDIEGSTELWERQPAAMGEALAHHDAMAASVVAAGGGRLVKTRGEGDATFSVFDSPAAAVVAATELQSLFANETFPGGIDLRIRIALHTGIAENRAGDFFGRVVNRCARLRSAAHGRQTVCSRTTADLVVDDLPETVWLRDLGEYQLKGLERAEQVFQVCWSGGADSFPPLRTITPPRHNLPVRRTRFLGRDKQLHEVGDLIGDRQLVTIVGANGCGKTRLAIEVGERILPAFPDGVWLVELAALADPAGVVAAVGAVLSLRESAPSLLDRLRAFLADKHLLLILDNCEHLVDGVAQLVDGVLAVSTTIHVLATSRQPLGSDGEVIWRLPSLLVPDNSVNTAGPELLECGAVQLFVDRAQQARPGFAVDEHNAEAVAEICRRLDGMPLAVELAAARVRTFGPRQIADGLAHLFHMLSAPRSQSARQQTLEASIAWSHDLLSEAERVVFRRLGAFNGSFSLEAAVIVAGFGAVAEADADLLLASLVDKSLVVANWDGPTARFRLLEAIGVYALDRLREAGEWDETMGRHYDYYASFVADASRDAWGDSEAHWVSVVAADYPNVRAALTWGVHAGRDAQQLAMATKLATYWWMRGPLDEGVAIIERALSRPGVDDRIRVEALMSLCLSAFGVVDHRRIGQWAATGLKLAVTDNDRATLWYWKGLSDLVTGVDPSEPFEQCIELGRRGKGAALPSALADFASWLLLRDPSRSRALLEEAVTIRIGSRQSHRHAEIGLANWYLANGDVLEARRIAEAAIAEADASGDLSTQYQGWVAAAQIAVAADDRAAALTAAGRVEDFGRQSGHHYADAVIAYVNAVIHLADGRPKEAADILTAGSGSTVALSSAFRVSVMMLHGECGLAGGSPDAVAADVARLTSFAEAARAPLAEAYACILDSRRLRAIAQLGPAYESALRGLEISAHIHNEGAGVIAAEALAGTALDQGANDLGATILRAAQAMRDRLGFYRSAPERTADIAALTARMGDYDLRSSREVGAYLRPTELAELAKASRPHS